MNSTEYHNASAVPLEFQQEDARGFPILSRISEEELSEHQRADPSSTK